MKRLVLAALAMLALAAGTARAGSIGVGVYGGAGFPVLQDDQDKGSLYGLRIPVKLIPLLTAEPFFSDSDLGDKTFTVSPGISATREGSDVTTYGLNAMLTMGGPLSFYPYAGIGSAKFKRTGQDETFTSYQLGVGLGLHPIPKIGVDLRGELQAAAKDGVARKLFNISLGVSYALVSLP